MVRIHGDFTRFPANNGVVTVVSIQDLGYEILSEPQVHNVDQWSKIGKYNTFITKELRKITNKTIIYSMNIPIDLKSEIKVNAENLAKMSPHDESISTNFLTSVGYLITNSHAMYPPSECPTRIISPYFINSFRINSRRNSTNSSIL